MRDTAHLLLVHPDEETRGVLLSSLREAGYSRVSEAEDGACALNFLLGNRIDLLITEIPLGALDGWRLARLVRSGVFQTSREIPILVFTRSFSERIAEATAKEYEINALVHFEQRAQLPSVVASLLERGPIAPPRPTLLVIEDNPDTCEIVRRVLGKRFMIESAADGLSGLASWRATRHDLVLLDVMLPGMSGPDVLKAMIKERPSQSVVIMTAANTPEHASDLVLHGAADFIAKPFRAEQLRRVCDIAARREDYMLSNTQFARRLDLLDREKGRAIATLESIGDGVITTGTDGTIEYLNPVAERLTGWTQKNAVTRPLSEIFQLTNEFTRRPISDPVQRCLGEGRIIELGLHNILVHRTGSETAIDAVVSPIKDHSGRLVGAVLVFHDVTQARKLNRQLTHQATHDSLTGLINRTEFERVLARLLSDSQSNGSEHVLCYLDLDQFKVVNDTCGHMAGDQLLQQIAVILQQQVRKCDLLARLGGDEFGVLLEFCTLQQAQEIATKLSQAVQDIRFSWQDKLFAVGVSIGLVPITPENLGIQDAMATADAACYLAKESGRNRVHVYSPNDGEIAKRYGEMQWVSRINRALEEDRLRLYYQQIVPSDDRDNKGEHFELLIRMVNEAGDIIPPGFFLPAAERYDLTSALDRWVIRTALNWLEENPERQRQLICCAINLSGKSLSDEHFHDFVAECLEVSGLPPEKLCFEITETAAITNLQKATDFIHRFKSMGCYFALDDFGSGMSSFAYLKNLPVDYLKIDGLFVKDIADDPIDYAMVKSINDIGHTMGLKTIAEFVENDAILECIREIGVDYVQGYGIALPKPLETCDDWHPDAQCAISTMDNSD